MWCSGIVGLMDRLFSIVSLFFVDYCCLLFFFKQKTAYEMRISDWSSDVCSSDLERLAPDLAEQFHQRRQIGVGAADVEDSGPGVAVKRLHHQDRKSVVSGKSVSVRVDLGGRRSIKKKNMKQHQIHHSHNALFKTHTQF